MPSLPLHMVPEPDDPALFLPFVDAAVDGRTHRFMLDTGAGTSRLRADAATAGLPVVGTKQSHGVFGTVTDELVMVGSLELGPIVKTDLTVVRTAHDDRPSLLGMDVFGGMAMVVDYGGASLDLIPSGSRPTAWAMRRSPNGQPFLELDFSGVTALACWDTGAALTVVDAGFQAAHEELFTEAGMSSGTDSIGQRQETPTFQMAACATGGITLAAHQVAVVPLPREPMPMDLVLGYPAICRFVWTMDYPLDRWSAVPSA